MSDPEKDKEQMDRTNDTLRRMLKTPPKPHKQRETGKPVSRGGSDEKANKPNKRP